MLRGNGFFWVGTTITLGFSSALASVHHSSSNSMKIEATNCNELVAYAQNVQKLFLDVYPRGRVPSVPACEAIALKRSHKAYSMNLTSLLPPAYLKNGNVMKPTCDGPNCFNNVMFIKGAAMSLRYSDEPELFAWINSPLCRRLDPSEQRSTGDVTVIKKARPAPSMRPDELVHAQIHLDEQNCFSKNGQDLARPYGFYACQDLNSKRMPDGSDGYPVSVGCQRQKRSWCKQYGESYRCQNFSNYWAKLPATVRDDIDCLASTSAKLEKQIGSALKGEGQKCAASPTAIQKKLAQLTPHTPNGFTANQQASFVKRLLEMRVSSLQRQTMLMESDNKTHD